MNEQKPAKSTVVWSDLANQAFQRHFKLAIGYGSSHLEPEHLLIALADLEGGVARKIFSKAGAVPAELKATAEAALTPNLGVRPLHAGMPSERWKNVTLMMYSNFPGIATFGTGHVLYAIVGTLEYSTSSSPVLAYLKEKGLTSESIRAQVDLEAEQMTRESPHYDKSKMRLNSETPWGRSYEIGPKRNYCESKFQTGEAKITLAEIRVAWPKWTLKERVDFTNNYNMADPSKLGEDDQQVMSYLIGQVSPDERSLLSWMVGRFYKNREEAFKVLSRWLQDETTSDRASLFESLAHLDATAALPMMRKCLDAWLKNIDLDHFPENPTWEQKDPYHECASGAGILYRLTEEDQYRTILEKLANFPDQSVKIISNRDLKEVAERR